MNPLLIEFPEEIETERLVIRVPRPGDGPEVRAAVKESLAELRPWMPWAAGELPDETYYEVRVRESRAKFLTREDIWLLIFLKGTHTLVGCTGLHRMDWEVPRFEIGYWARTPHAGNGYITEAVNGLTAFAFEQLGARRMEIRCDALNERSAAVARRAGYKLEATLHNEARHHLNGRLRDTLIYAKTAPDDNEVQEVASFDEAT